MRRLAAVPLTLAAGLAAAPGAGAAPGFRRPVIGPPTCAGCRAFSRNRAPVRALAPRGRGAPLGDVPPRRPRPEPVTPAAPGPVTPRSVRIGPGATRADRPSGDPGAVAVRAHPLRRFGRAGAAVP